jgi:MoaA/NifB/PqqE/SkfB family radical SAM enzyme
MTFTEELAHILKISDSNYEQKLLQILIPKMGLDAAQRYRNSYRYSYQAPKKAGGLASLTTITINISNNCNFKCIMCDVPGNNRANIELGIESIQDFMYYSSQSGVQCCMLGSGSEITMNNSWRQVVELALKYFPDVILFTNGSRLRVEDLEFFVSSGLSRLFVSLDASSRAVFKDIRGYDALNKIEDSIFKLVELKNKQSSLTPLIRVSFVVQDANKHEVNQFSEKWLRIVDSIEFQDLSDISSFRDKDFANRLPTVKGDPKLNAPKCHYPFTYASIWADGNISPCCTSYGRDCSDISLGNLKEPNWADDAHNKLRVIQESFISGDWESLPNSCRHCLLNANTTCSQKP